MNTYTTQFVVPCLNNGIRVLYTLTLETEATVMVEDIQQEVAALEREPMYHEAMADRLAARLPGSQTLEAFHHGTHIRTAREGGGKT